jgi:hypothetical protein
MGFSSSNLKQSSSHSQNISQQNLRHYNAYIMSHENRPNNINAPTSPAVRIVLAALVVVEVEALVLLGDEAEVPVAVPVAALLVFPLLELPTTPPKTFAGTVVSLAFAAADLKESSVSCPLDL